MTKRPEVISPAAAGDTFLTGGTVESSSFMAEAACKSIGDPDLFFSEEKGDIALAKSLCASCPVKAQCLTYGTSSEFGIFGGLTPRQRGIRLNRNRAVTPMIVNPVYAKYLLKAPVSEIASKYGVHPRTVHRWRKILKNNEKKEINETQR